MNLDKNTQIILAVGAVVVTAYFVNKTAQGINQAEQSVGVGAGLGVFAVLVAVAAAF